MSRTIDYYNSNADAFFDNTVNADMSAQYNVFEKRLYAGAHILDCGCGSGRDTKYFLEQGYEVTAIDGSKELCHKASRYTGIEVRQAYFQDINYDSDFDGIWACASLLHLNFNELPEVFDRLTRALKDGGILYVSFKYGDSQEERNGRIFTDLNEELLSKLVENTLELTIQEQFVSIDTRPEREEQWLNAILIKHRNAIVEIENKKFESETNATIIQNLFNKKVLRITKDSPNINFAGALDQLAQWVNIANIGNTLERSVEYVVEIPAKYREAYEAGEVFINKNKSTGVEWPTLMRKTENGQYRFVDDLPIKKQEIVNGNPFQDICLNYHNLVMQQQLADISKAVAETYKTVKMIERGQQDDRIALIDAGREQIILALALKDEAEKKERLRLASRDLLLGKEQIGKALVRRIEAFKTLPDNKFSLLVSSLKQTDYLDKKDDEIEEIQECYSLYIEATKMLAATFAYTGETAAVEQTFRRSVEFLQGVDFEKLKSIGISHKDVDLSDWFFYHPIEYIEAEKEPCLESAKEYEYVQIEVSGEELMEAIKDGGKI